MWGLSRDTWIRVGLWIFFTLVVITGVRSCSAGSAAGNVGNGVWILFFVGLIVAAVVSRDHVYLSWIFSAMALLILVILLGKIFQLFSWDTLGLLLVATAFIVGYMKTTGRTQSFFGFAAGVVAITWFYMFAQSTLKVDLGFLGDRITGDKLIIGLLTIGLLTFATWKRSVLLYALSFLVLAAWLGDTLFNQISNNFPKVLIPTVSEKTKNTWEEVWDAFLNRVKEAVKSEPKSPTPTPAPAPAASATPPKKELRHRVEKRSLKVQPPDGKGVMLKAEDVPWAKNARYQVVFRLTQNQPGKLFIEVNGHKEEGGRPFDFDHRITDQEVTVVFFDNVPGGLRGDPKYFVPGTNWIKFSSPGINVNICYARIEVEYWS